MRKIEYRKRVYNVKMLVSGLAVFFIINFTSTAFAKYITINTSVSTTVTGSEATLDIKLKNLGDDPAFGLSVKVLSKPGIAVSSKIPTLEPGAEKMLTLKTAIETDLLQQIVPLMIYYKDGKGHPFSVLSYAIARSDGAEPSRVSAKIEPIELSRKRAVVVKAKSIDGKSRHVDIRMLTPDELTVTPKNIELDIPGAEEVDALFELSNLNATSDSTYLILGIVSEKRKKGLFEEITLGKVTTITSKSIIEILTGRPALWVLGLLAFGYIMYEIIHRRQHHRNLN